MHKVEEGVGGLGGKGVREGVDGWVLRTFIA